MNRWPARGLLVLVAGCSPSAVEDPAPSAAPAPVGAPPATALFERRADSERGFTQVREVKREDGTSLLRVETNYFGGASDSAAFGVECLADLCIARGFSHYVVLSPHAVRYGTTEAPGNDWEAMVGFLQSADGDVAASFPTLVESGREYRVWAAYRPDASSLQGFMQDVYPSDLWELFTSIHFHYRTPETSGEGPANPLDPARAIDRADETKKKLEQGGPIYRSGSLGRAGKAAADAGRWDDAETWGKELLQIADKGGSGSGQAVHDSSIILGRVALHRGNVDMAEALLLKAGMTTGSPVLGSFGPNMMLARELLQAGEREVVLQYFELCGVFWKHGHEKLDEWTRKVEAGGMPDFGANLVY